MKKYGFWKRAVSCLLALVMLLGMMPMNAFAAEGAEPITEPTETTENVEESEAAEILRQAAKDAIFPLGNFSGNIAVLGDSTISGYPQYSALSTYLSVADGYTVTDISKAGDTVAGQLNKWNALSVEAKNSLNYVFVQIGLNDMRNLTPESFRTRYKGLIAQIRADSPDAMLILGTMVPCKARWKYLEPNNWEEVQARWESANEDIKNFYYDCDRVAYLHTDALGQDDNLRTEYDHGDHIHPNASGAKVIAYSWYLAAIGHSHRYNSTVTAPTCTEQGYTTYTCECGDSYVDSYTAPLGHSYEAVVTAPTCTEQGFTTYTCTVCGDEYEADFSEATGKHSYVQGKCTACDRTIPDFTDKTVSILGDSISTMSGVSNNTDHNSTIGNNASYYTSGSVVSLRDTWWQQVIDVLDMQLLVNNSWSGSCVFQPRKGEASVGYTDRCVNLHNDHTGKTPDVVFVFLGTNDFKSCYSTVGVESDIDYQSIITDNGDGTYTYATATTTCEAYAIMLHKISVRYPDADVYCLNLLARKASALQPTEFNKDIATIAARFGCTVIDLENCGISQDAASMEKYMYDGQVHPNCEGMDLISQAVLSVLLETDAEIVDIDATLTNVLIDTQDTAALINQSYSASVHALNTQQPLSVTVKMNGQDITQIAYNNGNIFIENVIGDVEIIAEAERGELAFEWKCQKDVFANMMGDGFMPNALDRQRGTIENGVFNDVYFKTQHTVQLMHDKNWIIEWKGSGNGGFMLSDATSGASSTVYFRRHTQGYLHVFGMYDGSKYQHYGVKPKDYGIDDTSEHVYRLVNRVYEDGSNMVYLYVDGVELGAMNNHYVGYVYQGTTSDWMNGRDFYINYIGTSSHPLTNYSLEYLVIREDHCHTYNALTTDSTCTEQGFTTYTCICGNSYVDDYVDALGHNWEDGSCTICGEADPDYHIPGDINGDGEVDNKDLTRLFRYLSNYDVEVVEAALDVNGDGSVNNKDLTRLFRYLSGYDVEIH